MTTINSESRDPVRPQATAPTSRRVTRVRRGVLLGLAWLTTLALAVSLVLGVALAPTPAAAADLEEIRARGVLRHLGVPYANFVTGAGDGLDVELTRAFAESLGVRYEYVQTDWGTAIPDLLGRSLRVSGAEVELLGPVPVRGDILANGLTMLPWREKAVVFSPPTFPSQIWLVARADSPVHPIAPTGDIRRDVELTRALLRGRSVLTVRKTCLDPDLYGLAGAGARVVAFGGKLNEVAPALLNGEAEMTILDVPDALIALEKWHGRLKILGPVTDRQLMAAAFPADAPRLREAYATFLAKAQLDGSYLRLVRRYYPAAAGHFPSFFSAMR